MSDGVARLSVAELLAEVADERVDPDAFDRLGVAMQPIELATSLGVAQVLPVGGLVAGAREAGFFDEGFQQDRAVRVTGMPVIREASGDQGEDVRGEVTALDPRQGEEAGVVDDEVQISRALLVRPADERIPRLGLPGARSEGQQGDHLAGGAYKVAQLCSRDQPMPEIVMALDVGIPKQRLALVAYRLDREPSQVYRRHARRLQDRALDVGVGAVGNRLGIARRRQRNEPIGGHPEHCHAATHILQSSVGATPGEPLADLAREPGAAERRGLREQRAHPLDLGGREGAATVAHRSARVGQSQDLLVRAQHEHVLVETHPAAPQHCHTGLAVALAPEGPTTQQGLFCSAGPSRIGALSEHLTLPNRPGTDPYTGWCGRESPRGPPIPI